MLLMAARRHGNGLGNPQHCPCLETIIRTRVRQAAMGFLARARLANGFRRCGRCTKATRRPPGGPGHRGAPSP